MAGTLTNSTGATSFRFIKGDPSSPATSIHSISNWHVNRNRNTLKASLRAVINEPLLESTNLKPTSLYDVLNVKRTATPSEIKSAYRSLAKQYHPDAANSNHDDGDDDRDFIGIRNAYVTLSDPTARALYDMKFSTGVERRSGGMSAGFYVGRRWETDQCW